MESKTQLQPRLVIIEGNEKGKILTLKSGTQTLGRSKADVVLNDPRISRSHVSITFDSEQGTIFFSDLNSLNGTQVNGDVKQSGPLKDGDQIQLGDTSMDLQILSVSHEITAQKHLAEMLKTSHSSPPTERAPEIIPPAPLDDPGDHTVQCERPKTTGSGVRLPKRLVLYATLALVISALVVWNAHKPNDAEMNSKLAEVTELLRQERTDQALAEAIRMSAQFPTEPAPQLLLGQIYYKLDKYELAIGSYQRAHDMRQFPPSLHAKLLRLYARVGAKEGVTNELNHIDKLIQNGPYTKETILEIALTFLDEHDKLGQSFERPYILAKALQKEIAPQEAIGYKLEAQILATQGKYQQALAPLSKAAELAPQDEWPLENTTFALLKLGNAEATLASATEWMKRHPNSSKPLLVLAYLKLNSGNTLEALPFVQKIIQMRDALKTDLLYPEALSVLGQIYAKSGQNTEANSSLNESCSLGYQPACEFQKSLDSQAPREASSTVVSPGPPSNPNPAPSQSQTPVQ